MTESSLFQQVLLIEDDPAHMLLLKRALGSIADEIVAVTSLNAAFAALDVASFDLIITDLKLPDSEGVSHVRTLSEKAPESALVVITSSTRLEDAVLAMKSGAKDFLLKDFQGDFEESLRIALSRVFATMQLERERKKLQTAVENTDDALAVVSPEGQIQYGNSAFKEFQRVCGKGSGNGSGNFLSLFVSDRIDRGEKLAESIKEQLASLQAEEVWTSQFKLVAETGDLWFEMSASGIRNALSSREIIIWIRDISEQKHREEFQREMLSTTTHDLKGPLGAVLTGIELLQDQVKGQDKAQALLIRVESATRGVVNLIDEFLSARRIEEGNLVLHPVEVNLTELLHKICDTYQSIAQSRKITFTINAADEIVAMVDPLSLERILGNLISNAFKFTQPGGAISVGLGQSANEVTFSVEDSGSGMEPAEVKRIFERFSRLDRHQQLSGTGLGLFVVKSLVSAHGGGIEVASKLGTGSRISVNLPRNPPVSERGELFCLI